MRKGVLIILRHGNTLANSKGIYSGWIDEDLSSLGISQAHRAAQAIRHANIQFDLAFSSMLKRANKTAHIIITDLGQNISIEKEWRLNECHCGIFTGKTAVEAKREIGIITFKKWRHQFSFRPPPLPPESPLLPWKSSLYRGIPPNILPKGESLEMAWNRFAPFWNEKIIPALKEGKIILIVTNGNLLRSIIKEIEGLTPEQAMTKPCSANAVPLKFEYENDHFLPKEILSFSVSKPPNISLQTK